MIVAIFLHFASFFDMTLDRLMNFKTELHLQKKQTDLEKIAHWIVAILW